MKSMKKTTYLGAITLVIAGLLIVVSASAMVQTSQIQPQKPTVVIKNGHEIEGRDIATAKSLQTANRYSPVPRAAVLVATGTHPAAASDSLGNVVAGFEADDNVWFTASIDGGASFNTNAVGWVFTNPPSYPDADSCGDGRFIGAILPNYLDNDGSDLHKVITADPNNIPDGWSAMYWTWTTAGAGYYDFTAVACGGYTKGDPAEDAWAYGGHSMVGTYNHTVPVVGTPFFSYQSNSGGSGWIYRFDTTKTGGTSTAMDIDQVKLHGFAVWNYNNAGNMDIYAYENNFGVWQPYGSSQIHPDIKEKTINSVGNDTYLDIAALNDHVIIVSQRDGDVVAYYSANALTTVNEQLIATGAFNPRVVFTSEGNATCTFIKDEKVYFSTTEDGGATWSTPEAINEPENQNVPEEFKGADVCGLGALWQQSDGNIYFATIGSLPPILDISGITGGTKVSATISNTGGTAATNVKWTMEITGGILKRINKTYTDTILTLAPASPQTIQSTGLILGLGKITITISAVCDEGASKQVSIEGKVFIFFIKI